LNVEILKLIVYGVLGLFAGIIILVVVRSKSFSKVHFSKTGISFEAEAKSRTNHFYMTRRIQDLDADFRFKCRRITNDLRAKVMSGLVDFESACPLVKVALASSLRIPLYQAIEENHFKKKFSKQFLEFFLNNLLEEIKIDYEEFAYLIKAGCLESQSEMVPVFDSFTFQLRQLLQDFWVRRIAELMVQTCERKIATYEDYLPLFTELGDTYMVKVAETCRDKNLGYIESLRLVAGGGHV